jgi:RNA polymerase sigma factor (sigma-70 family)
MGAKIRIRGPQIAPNSIHGWGEATGFPHFTAKMKGEVRRLGEIDAGQRVQTAVGVAVAAGQAGEAARKRAAVELIRRHEATLRRTARRYSICSDDAEDAYQRGLEILLTKAPTADLTELIRWMQTVTKHEALAVRRNRERMLGNPIPRRAGEEEQDWVELLPSTVDGPAMQAERRERIARSREALGTLKPHELRALTLLAEGYSYAEIGQITGWSYTKINRCLAEGRQRFRAVLESSEEGRRCEDLGPLLSAFCDGETDAAQESLLRDHLRACAHCRSKLRTFRAAPEAAAALAPFLAGSRPLLERAQEILVGLANRIPGRSGAAETTIPQIAAGGGSRGAGMAALAKVMAACVGTAGGAAVCVAAGVVPADLDPLGKQTKPAIVTRSAAESMPRPQPPPTQSPPATPPAVDAQPATQDSSPAAAEQREEAASAPAPPPVSEPAAAEFSPEASAPAATVSPGTAATSTSGGSGGGGSGTSTARSEFGP